MKKTYVIDDTSINVKFKKNSYGVWQYEANLNGKRLRKSSKAKQFETAEKNLMDDLRSFVKVSSKSDGLPLADLWEMYRRTPSNSNPGPGRLKEYERQVNDFIAYCSQFYPDVFWLADVSEQVAREYIQYIRDNGRYKQGTVYKRGKHTVTSPQHVRLLSTATKNAYLATLRMMFDIVAPVANLEHNPFAKIPKLRNEKESREIFTLAELELLETSAKAKASYLYPLIMVAPYTGLREGDICTLLTSEVDLSGRWINRGKQRKTGQPVRIPIMPKLHDFLKEWSPGPNHFFPELAKVYLTNSTKIGSDFTALLEAHDIQSNKKVPGRSRLVSVKDVHSFRHTFVYLAAINNIPLPVVQSIVGHMSPEMTKMYMNHATDSDKQQYFDQLSASIHENKLGLVEIIEDILESDITDQEKITAIRKAIKNPVV